MSKFLQGQEVKLGGKVVTIDSVKSGWATVITKDGGTRKARVGELEMIKVKAEKPAVEPKAAKEPKAPREKKAKPERAPRGPTKASLVGTAQDDRLVKADLSHYVVADVATPSGRKVLDIGDEVATHLRGLPLADVFKEAAAASGRSVKELQDKYSHLNPGMQRMNLGNLIRGGSTKAQRDEERAQRAAEKAKAREAAATEKAKTKAAKPVEEKAGYQGKGPTPHPK